MLKHLAATISLLILPSLCFADHYWDVDVVYGNSKNYASSNLTVGDNTAKTVSSSQIAMLHEVREKITSESGTYSKLILTDAPVLNAWAQNANGVNTVFITFQMLDMIGNDADMCAALLGHEYTHIKFDHMKNQKNADFILNLLAGIAGGLIDAAIQTRSRMPSTFGQDMTGLAANGISSSFSRSEELEADDYGTRWMMQAGYDPQGAVRLFESLLEKHGNDNSFLATHPMNSDRIGNVQKIIAQYKLQISTHVASNLSDSSNSSLITKAEVEPSEIPTGQVGVVLNVKQKYRYVIFTGVTSAVLPVKTKIQIVKSDNEIVDGEIERAVEGYYSASFYGYGQGVKAGDKILVGR